MDIYRVCQEFDAKFQEKIINSRGKNIWNSFQVLNIFIIKYFLYVHLYRDHLFIYIYIYLF